MTHDPLFVARLLQHPSIFKTAVVFDFIPMDEYGPYLRTPSARINYHIALCWLGWYDSYFPISQATSRRLHELVDVDNSNVTVVGAPIDSKFEGLRESQPGTRQSDQVLVIGGDDPRKNVEVVIRAHAACEAVQSRRIGLTITGSYSPAWQDELISLYRTCGGSSSLLAFPGHVTEPMLFSLYQSAICIICPSRSEGFSLPVVEAMAAGVPVIASDIPPHDELMARKDLLFQCADDTTLAHILDRAVTDPKFRRGILASQSVGWQQFRAPEVASRFWSAIQRGWECSARPVQAPNIVVGKQPKLAFLTPLPPDSGRVADYSAACLPELARLTNLQVFSDVQRPPPSAGSLTVHPLSALPHLSGFDRVVSVIANSRSHTPVFELLRRHGGACICHDVRLQELARSSSNPMREAVEISEPLFLHSQAATQLIAQAYRTQPVRLPYCLGLRHDDERITVERRTMSRDRLAISDGEVAIAACGCEPSTDALEEWIAIIQHLQEGGLRTRLLFIDALPMNIESLNRLADRAGLGRRVALNVAAEHCSGCLAAADLVLQMRPHRRALETVQDCIAIGLPAIVSAELAEPIDPPTYIRCVPHDLSGTKLAEVALGLLDARFTCHGWEVERKTYYKTHSFSFYAKLIVRALGIADPGNDAFHD